MKLNQDLVRFLLLAVEETTYYTEDLEPIFSNIDEIHELEYMKKYSSAEIVYTAERLEEAGFISADIRFAEDRIYFCEFCSLTYEGHKYLDSIRTQDVWDNVKKYIIKAGGSVALPMIASIAERVIEKKLGFTQ